MAASTNVGVMLQIPMAYGQGEDPFWVFGFSSFYEGISVVFLQKKRNITSLFLRLQGTAY